MDRYEYRTMKTAIETLGDQDVLARLNAMGSEGWNLVATVARERHGHSHEVHLLFSRRVSA